MSEGRPIVRRFVVRRRPVGITPAYPWAVRDRNAPHWLGHAATFADAMRKIDDRVRAERGMPPRIPVSRAEVRARMAHGGRDRFAEWYVASEATR